MSGARKFLNLPADDRLLLVEAVALVVVVRGGEAVLPRDGVWGAAITAEPESENSRVSAPIKMGTP